MIGAGNRAEFTIDEDPADILHRPGHVRPMTFPELFRMPTVLDLATAGAAVGVSVNTAYQLVACHQFPCQVWRLGWRYKVPTMHLMKALGVECVPVYSDHVAEGAAFSQRAA